MIGRKKEKKKSLIWWAIGSALTVIGFLFIPTALTKYGNKAYKSLLCKEKIDFENMGPEIIPFEKTKKEIL